jgi:hypothetical protein
MYLDNPYIHMARKITFDMIKTQVSTLYKKEKRRKNVKSLPSEQFKNLVLGVFQYFRLEIAEGNIYEKWYKVLMTTFASRGGVKNAEKTRGKKKPKNEQTEFKL